VIREYHDFSPTSLHTTDINPTHLKSVPDLDPNSEYVLSTRIRVSRSISGFPFPPASNRGQRRLVESVSKRCVSRLTGDLEGTYISLNDMTNAENDDLIQRHILFDNPNEWAITAGLSKDWPDARGIFMNVEDVEDTPDFIVWVNEEDHLRIMTMKKGGDIAAVFEKLARGLQVIEEGLKEEGHSFLHDDHLGFVVGCPSNLGTGMRASMHVKLIRLSKLEGFDQMCVRMGLEVRGKHGETDKAKSGIFDISNRHRLGFSEIELIQLMIDGVTELVKMEKQLASGEEVDCTEKFQKV
jgi:creatine kinase